MAEIILSSNNNISCRLTYDVDQSITENTTTIKIKSIAFRTTKVLNSYYAKCSVYVRETDNTLIKRVVNRTDAYATPLMRVDLSTTNTWLTPASNSYTVSDAVVSHDDDGSKRIKFTVSAAFVNPQGYAGASYSGSATLDLDTIPRLSTLSFSDPRFLGEPFTIFVNKADPKFVNMISWSCGNYEDVDDLPLVREGDTEVSWTPSVELAQFFPNSDTVDITLTVRTWADEILIGISDYDLQVGIPDTVAPTGSVDVSDVNPKTSEIGLYIQNQSTIKVDTAASGIYGSTVSDGDITVTILGETKYGSSVTFSGVNASGDVDIVVNITDSRGKSRQIINTVSIVKYNPPSARLIRSSRCIVGDDGVITEIATGDSLVVYFSAYVTSIIRLNGNEANTASYYLRYWERGNLSSAAELPISDVSGLIVEAGRVYISINESKAYEFCIVAKDTFTESSSIYGSVSVAFALMDFCRDERAIGFGQRATTGEAVDFGLDIIVHDGFKIKCKTETAISDSTECVVTLGFLKKLFEANGLQWKVT